MRISYGFYIATITPLVCIPVYNLPPLYYLIGEIHASDSIDGQPNPPQISQTPMRVHHSRSNLPPDNFYNSRRKFMNNK